MSARNLTATRFVNVLLLQLLAIGCGDDTGNQVDGGSETGSDDETGGTSDNGDTSAADDSTSDPGTSGPGDESTGTDTGDAGSTGDASLNAVDDEAVTARGVPVRIDVLANDDADGLDTVVRVVEDGQGGAAAVLADGTVEYRPGSGFDGDDSFSYEVLAGGASSTASVSINVLPRAGTVSGGQLYQVFETAIPAELEPTEEEADEGMIWLDVNRNGDRLGSIGSGCTNRDFIVTADNEVIPVQYPADLPDDCAGGGALALNDDRLVVGFWWNADYQSRTFTWTESEGAQTVSLEPDALLLTATDVDNDGLMVGFTEDYDSGGDWQGFRWELGTPVAEVEYFSVADYSHVVVSDINENGDIVGHVTNAGDGFSRPQLCFVIDGDGERVIELPEGVSSMSCRGLNDRAIASKVKQFGSVAT